MNKLKLIIAPDYRLNQVSKKVEFVDQNISNILEQMLEVMYDSKGIGLAAPQVGILKRIIVMDCSLENEQKKAFRFINPKIVKLSDSVSEYEEGCLSLPTQSAKVIRPSEVQVEYTNEKGKQIVKVFKDLEATCLQHEIDHLNGKLFVDHISKLRKNLILKKLKKYKKKKY